ncbi:MAG TPA: hypothetical protein PKY96_15120, partial [Flavobacteriales bacterium]|nr:hypothetical protein [Flavobacteriales bacterium]
GRLAKGELTGADEELHGDTVKYYTMNKRVVYGGGGIMPDVFVPIDTTLSSAYFGQLVRKGVLNTFALTYVDDNRDDLKRRYNSVEQFRQSYQVGDVMLDALAAYAAKEGVAEDAEGMARSHDLIALRLKALMARDLWDTSAYWQVINAENMVDRSFQRALEALGDNSFQRLGMSR